MTMDKTLVEMSLKKSSSDETGEYIEKTTGIDPYTGGWSDIKIE